MISKYLKELDSQLQKNEPGRHGDLIDKLAGWIVEEWRAGNRAQLNFICTHNSRRSQFAQTWAHFTQRYLGIDTADSFSGGTEVTACNERTADTLRRAGFQIDMTNGENPVYTLSDSEYNTEIRLWSKRFDDEQNPSGRFAAVMTCDHADANCPFIPGAAIRLPLTYTDPKYADDTDEEESAYDRASALIATDLLRVFKRVKQEISG